MYVSFIDSVYTPMELLYVDFFLLPIKLTKVLKMNSWG